MEIQNGARILQYLHRTHDWPGLCREFGVDNNRPFKTDTFQITLYSKLKELRKLGLVEFNPKTDQNKGITGKIKIADQWVSIQNALGLPPLKGIADLSSLHGKGMVAIPFLGRPTPPAEKIDVFVAMPFLKELRPVYEKHIKKVVEKRLGLKVKRGDDIFSAKPVMSDIWNDICAARLVIADCTRRNRNVFYEIGLAHAVGKPVVLITQNEADMPFDTKHIRYLKYSYDTVEMKDFEKKLAETIKMELNVE